MTFFFTKHSEREKCIMYGRIDTTAASGRVCRSHKKRTVMLSICGKKISHRQQERRNRELGNARLFDFLATLLRIVLNVKKCTAIPYWVDLFQAVMQKKKMEKKTFYYSSTRRGGLGGEEVERREGELEVDREQLHQDLGVRVKIIWAKVHYFPPSSCFFIAYSSFHNFHRASINLLALIHFSGAGRTKEREKNAKVRPYILRKKRAPGS